MHSKAPLKKQSKSKNRRISEISKNWSEKRQRRWIEKRDASLPENELHTEVQIFLQGLKMISNSVPSEATHILLDSFEKSL